MLEIQIVEANKGRIAAKVNGAEGAQAHYQVKTPAEQIGRLAYQWVAHMGLGLNGFS